jgi:hypothetical protein
MVEGKNGSVIRKHMGRNHILKENAGVINVFNEQYFNIYLNFHRVSGYATNYTDKRGKIRKKYDQYMTPYSKLKSLPTAEQYLKKDISFELLDKTAYAQSDNNFAESMKKAKEILEKSYKKIKKILPV